MPYKYKLKEAEVGDTKVVGGVKYTVRDIDPETGAIAWKVDYVPAFDSTFKEFQELRQFMTKLSRDTKDETIDSIAKEVRELFNKYRTHLRKNYSEEYKKMAMTEEEVEEMSTSAGAGSYLTKYAFKLPKKQKEIVPEDINLPSLDDIDLQKTTDIKYKNYIDNAETFAKALADVAGELLDDENEGAVVNDYLKQALQIIKKEASKGIKESVGATLGPGPKAGPDGVKDNYYVKKFKYKLVPKDKNGNYVQKGSGLEVKNF